MKRTLLFANLTLAAAMLATAQKTPESMLGAALHQEEVQGDLKGAIAAYQKVVATRGVNRKTAAEALVHMAGCYQKLGDAESRKIYEQVVRDYADQKDAVATARARLGRTQVVAGTGITNRKLWTLPKGASIEGAASRDGRYIPYIDWDRYGDLYVHDLVTGADRRITNTGTDGKPGVVDEFAEEYAFSGDGNQLVYSWYRDDRDRYELRVVDLKGNGIPQFRRLFDNEDVDWISPDDWSPDGKWLAVRIIRRDKTGQIGLVSVQDGSLRVLKSVDWRGSSRISFSPDGKYLGYDRPESDDSRQSDVFVLATDGTREIPAVVHRGQDLMTGWSPDGKQLLFASDRNGSMGLWGLAFADGKPQGAPALIKADIGRFDSMGLTPSGALHFAVHPAGAQSSIKVAAFDFGAGKFLSSPSDVTQEYLESNSGPSWSPDGKELAYLSERGRTGSANTANRVIVIRSAETHQAVRELRPKLNYWNGTAWAPDGRSFLTRGADFKGRYGIYQIDAQTGDVSPLRLDQPGEPPALTPKWSLDGKSLYFSRRLSGGKESAFFQRDLASGKETEVIRRISLGAVNFSPDGRYIATPSVDPSTNSRTMLLIPTAGGEPREMMRVPAEVEPEALSNFNKGRRVAGVMWAPDSRSFITWKVSSALENANSEAWRIPIGSGEPGKLAENLPFGPNSVHLDGRRIAYTVSETAPRQPDEVWVLENFLPATSAKK